jgi:hypothetical protein
MQSCKFFKHPCMLWNQKAARRRLPPSQVQILPSLSHALARPAIATRPKESLPAVSCCSRSSLRAAANKALGERTNLSYPPALGSLAVRRLS